MKFKVGDLVEANRAGFMFAKGDKGRVTRVVSEGDETFVCVDMIHYSRSVGPSMESFFDKVEIKPKATAAAI